MMTKEQKMRYGEQLRRQMKQKEEKKRNEDAAKRGRNLNNDKEILQQKFENGDNGFYGRPGGGAPHLPKNQHQPVDRGHAQYQNGNEGGNIQRGAYQDQGRIRTQENYEGYNGGQVPGVLQNASYGPGAIDQTFQQPQYGRQPGHHNLQQEPSYLSPYQQQPNANNRVPTDRSVYENQQQNQQQHGYQNAPFSQPTYQQQQQQQQLQGQGRTPNLNNYYQPPQFQQPQPIYDLYQQPIEEINQKHEQYRQKTVENQELMEIHKKGGRNLLQLENMTVDQQQIKHKQQEEMRRQLEMQMREAQDRKKMEQERLKQEELEEERKNQEYLLLQKRKIEDEERKKQEKQRELQEQNARNLEDKRRLEEEAKQKARQAQNRTEAASATRNSLPQSPRLQKKEMFSRQSQFQDQANETTSSVSEQTLMEKGFDTGVSKQFFQNERRKDQERYNREKNLEAVTDEIKRLKDQINQQNELFKREIEKMKIEQSVTENEKRQAQRTIGDLEKKLKEKMEDDNERLFKALQRQETLKNQSQYDQQFMKKKQQQSKRNGYNDNPDVEILRPERNQRLVNKKYQVPREEEEEFNSPVQRKKQIINESNVSEDDNLLSLHGDSKKIPINLPNDKLSMSQLSDFARETQYFKNDYKSPAIPQKKTRLNVSESIAQVDEDPIDSRVALNRNKNSQQQKHRTIKDQLDELVDSRANFKKNEGNHNNWGEMSSVNSDITKEIEDLLRKKGQNQYNSRPPSGNNYTQGQYNGNNQQLDRPNSRLSNAGKKSLDQHGYEYGGASIGTINSGGGTYNTLDIDKIHDRNEKRLSNLRNLGVETINTNNEDGEQFSKLDSILNKYKQSRAG